MQDITLKQLQDLKKSKWWKWLETQLKRHRLNSSYLILQRNWQSIPEYTLDDLYKREIKVVSWIFDILDNEINAQQLQQETEVPTVENMDIWDVEDLFKTVE